MNHGPGYSIFKRTKFRFDGERFQEASSSSHPHKGTYSLAKYMGQPMVTGSNNPHNVKTEIMDLSTGSWTMAPDFPYAKAI